jgi:glycerophosphoryl diester phosphodiesterase
MKFFSGNDVAAHRGAWKTRGIPQNSIESLREAIHLGCGASELDVRMTVDEIFVLCHEATYSGKVIENHTYDELTETKLPNGENLPMLEKALMEGMKQAATRLLLDIKPSSTPEKTLITVEKLVKKVNEMGAQPWVFYLSTIYEVLIYIHQISPTSTVTPFDEYVPEGTQDRYLMSSFTVTDYPELQLMKRKRTK